jgi:hypothetical protein
MAFRWLTLYLRREPTVDPVWLQYGEGLTRWDVRCYSDLECQNLKGIFSWWHTNKPCRGCRTVILNCWRWAVVWLPDAPVAAQK